MSDAQEAVRAPAEEIAGQTIVLGTGKVKADCAGAKAYNWTIPGMTTVTREMTDGTETVTEDTEESIDVQGQDQEIAKDVS